MGNNDYMRPCPFCGGASLKVEVKRSNGWRQRYRYTASVRCNKCHARGSTGHCDTACDIEQAKGRAVANWNFRQIEMDMQMEDSDIIKALEHCVNGGDFQKCVYSAARCIDMTKDSLDLINRQKAEIDRLTVNMNAFGIGMTREKERADTARVEAIKEFAERLKNKFYSYYEGLDENTSKSKYNGETLMYYEVADMIENCIDNTVEEMTKVRHAETD